MPTKNQIPAGWTIFGAQNGDYQIGIDQGVSHSGTECAFVTNAVQYPRDFITLMQMFPPGDNLRGKRCRMRMWVKCDSVSGRGQPWMRVDGPHPGEIAGFDNHCDRPLLGTFDWEPREAVLDVPNDARNVAFGIILAGEGKVWIDDVELVPVDESTPTTSCYCSAQAVAKKPRKPKAAKPKKEA